ncbi:restriction endonuclease subunit S [Oceanobacillus sp. CF4.6]|uniref:restriction endonuclease subunit S n=1 Tax=Oceanobacillus sp. CF4.6 TaxID=3373080 RepID=UPI003EE6C7B4
MKNLFKVDYDSLPDEWDSKPIGNLFDFYGGFSASRSHLSSKGSLYLHYGDIHNLNKNYLNVDEDESWLPRLDKDPSAIKSHVFLQNGDIVYADASEDYKGIGKSVVIENMSNENFVSGLHTIIARDKSAQLEINYKRYCFSTHHVRKQFRALATGTSVYGISKSNIGKIVILIPTINEQQKIAKILSTVDEQIEQNDELIEKTKALKTGLIQNLLTKGIGHTEFKKTEVGEIPIEWSIKSLNKITDVRDGTHDSPKYINEGIPFITSKNLKEYGINYSDISYISLDDHKKFEKRSKVDDGDILFAMIGTIGNPVIVYKTFDFSIKNVALIKFHESTEVINKFILYLLQSKIIKKQFAKVSNGGVQKFLSLKVIRNLSIPIPTLEEQRKICDALSLVDEQLSDYRSEKDKLQQLKKGLMQKLLTGQIRVNV